MTYAAAQWHDSPSEPLTGDCSKQSNPGKLPSFHPIHIDVARNATDDFNPFHDKNRWQRVAGNPFSGPILLGFQLECLIEDQLLQYRKRHNE